ncbi:hypoxia-inducible factor 1-alpha-like isoform X2 [Babylonia areolata]|uniref:hypoxia-inducible factor 1-alpha-like isoform X2 n=1 Tax=Babylonia areolata TaxID=304850 RepID=UPI003FCEE8A7
MPYKNSEKRKEKSRDAARHRRGKESEVFYELANCLPMPPSVISQLDKASIMRLSISSLKIQEIMKQHSWSDDDKKGGARRTMDQLFPKALDGFVFILSREGDIVYINETVVKYLGIQQIEMMGQSIFDFCDPRDEDEIREAVSVRPHGGKLMYLDSEDRVFFIRMKCTLTSKGRNVNLKSASYKVIRCTGHMVMPPDMHHMGSFPYLLAVGEPIPHPANIEIPMDAHTFLSKHDMDMKFTYCDERVQNILNYSEEDLVGRSLFDFHHAVDSDVVERAYKDLHSKGQTMTGRYRFMAHGGGWAWVITQATVIHNNRNHKAQWVVCIHYVLTDIEEQDLVLSEVQTTQPQVQDLHSLMMPCTESIFSPKTADMDQGYFIPPHLRNKVKMTKSNEPEDLSYLAPTAGDVGMPLEPPFPRQDLFSSSSCSERKKDGDLMSPSLVVLEGLKQEPGLSPSLCHAHHMHHSSLTNLSPGSSVSPASCSSLSRMSSPRDYASVASPKATDSMDQFFHSLEMKCDIKDEDHDIQIYSEMDRAPYIPMNKSEDLRAAPPTVDSLLTVQKDVNPALQGKTEYVFHSRVDSIFEEPPPPPPLKPRIRDLLEGSTAVASIEQPPDLMFKQIKRPLDMNSLEKGPPEHKLPRLMGHELQRLQVPNVRSQKMLLNLLLKGEDPSGYRTMSLGLTSPPSKEGISGQLLNPLSCLTRHDCEVNAPTHYSPLLDGDELLTALDTGMPSTLR